MEHVPVVCGEGIEALQEHLGASAGALLRFREDRNGWPQAHQSLQAEKSLNSTDIMTS